MSLLMDALKKAEKDKKKAADETKPDAPGRAAGAPDEPGMTTVALPAEGIAGAKPQARDSLRLAPRDPESPRPGAAVLEVQGADETGRLGVEATRRMAAGDAGTIGLWGAALEASDDAAARLPALDRTLPSQRALNATLKDYFESSQPLERPGRAAAQEASGPRAFRVGDTVTRVSAETVFSATRRTSFSKTMRAGLGVALVLGVALIGLWVWSELDPGGSSAALQPPAPPPGMPAHAESPVPRPDVPSEGAGWKPAPAPGADASERAEGVEQNPIAELDLDPDPAPAPSRPGQAPADRNESAPIAAGVHSAPASERVASTGAGFTPAPEGMAASGSAAQMWTEPSAIRIRRSPSRERLDPGLSEAYEAFQAGNLPRAETLYRRAEAREPEHRDALLGLAAVAMRQGRTAEAVRYYRRLIELDPRDAGALAALASLGGSDQKASESRLKLLLDLSPNAGHLHFALGNLYAGQGRWAEAQAAYFKAYAGDNQNPDYAFNLAVSLDQLGQGKTALRYYRRSLSADARGARGFRAAEVLARVRALEAAGPGASGP